jgi:hypothetical protein
VERMPSKDEREQQKTNIDKSDRNRGTYSKRSESKSRRRQENGELLTNKDRAVEVEGIFKQHWNEEKERPTTQPSRP